MDYVCLECYEIVYQGFIKYSHGQAKYPMYAVHCHLHQKVYIEIPNIAMGGYLSHLPTLHL